MVRRLATSLVLASLAASPTIALSQPAILLWPEDESVAPHSSEVAEALSERGGLTPVDDGPLRARIAEGPRVDPLLFVSEAGRVAEAAAATITVSPESALDTSHRPEREYLADLATPRGVRGLVALALVRVDAHLAAGDRAAAQREAAFALTLDVAEEIDESSLSRGARAVVKAAREEIPRQPVVPVSVKSTPEGARVTLDGRLAGRAPLDVEVTPGFHVVRLDRPGFQPVARIFDVGLSGTELEFPLPAALGEPLLEQIATLADRGELALEDADIVALLGLAAQARYVGVVRSTDAGTTVTLFEPATRRSPGVASGRDAEAVARAIETATLGAPVRPRGAPPPPPPQPPRRHFYEKWWFWTAAGAVVVAGTVTVVLLSQPEPQGVVRWRD